METPEECVRRTQHSRDDLVINLVLAAIACPPEQRDQFIQGACTGDSALLVEVHRRVDWEHRLKGFLMTPVVTRERLDRPFEVGETVIGRFRIERVAGEGGMGIVYVAFDEKTQRRVALKCPLFEFRKRMPPEAQASLSVTHVNVCRVFEIHTAPTALGDVDFLTMEFIDGETLAARLREGPPLSAADCAAIARQLCAGLGAVHEQGVVHRDLKPGNVMLSKDSLGRSWTVIMDFGISQAAGFFTSHARGTADYVAPELWKGAPATAQSDIYALGVVLYETFSGGCKPFSADVDWHERLHGVPRLDGVVDRRVRKVLWRCVDPDPAKRFREVKEVGAALEPASTSRRVWMAGALAAVAVGVAVPIGRERFWPSLPVRLAILPPIVEGTADASNVPLMQGLVSDLVYRLRTLKQPRRMLAVLDPTQLEDGKGKDLDGALGLGATHAVSIRFAGWHVTRTPGAREIPMFSIVAELFEAATGRSIAKVQAQVTIVSDILLAFQRDLFGMVISELHLRAEAPAPVERLPKSAYGDYLRGLHFTRVDFENADQAIACFERVITAAPQSALGYAGLAEALLNIRSSAASRSGKLTMDSRALEALAKAEQLDPESAHVHLIAARFEALAGFFQRALSECQRAAELNPADSETFIRMGTYLFLLKRRPEAEAAFQKAVQLGPGFYKPHLDIGLLYFEIRDFKRAEQHWREAVRLAPGLTRARLNLAAIYQRTGRLDEARTMARECLAIRRTSQALELQGNLQGPSEAIGSYLEAIRIGPVAYTTWDSLAAAYFLTARPDKAIDAFQRGQKDIEDQLNERANDPERIAWCAYYHARLNERTPARERATEAERLGSLQGNVRKRLVLTYGWVQDFDAVFRLLDGAPRDLIVELGNGTDLPPELRREPRFRQLLKNSEQ